MVGVGPNTGGSKGTVPNTDEVGRTTSAMRKLAAAAVVGACALGLLPALSSAAPSAPLDARSERERVRREHSWDAAGATVEQIYCEAIRKPARGLRFDG